MLMSVSDIGMTATGTGHVWPVPALLVLCLAVIAMQTVAVVRERRLTARKNDYIACYVGQYLSLKYKEFPELCKWHSGSELTQIELIKVMHLLKKMLCGCVLLLPTLPAVAQERTDTTYVFRFVPTDDMFYVPFGDNRVDGYSRSESGHEANLLTAKLRSNRIKSELITRQGLTEDCFITKNHVGKGDYVTVRLTIPKDGTQPAAPKEGEKTAAPDETEKSDNALVAKEKGTLAEEPQTWPVQAEQPQSDETVQVIPVEKEDKADAYRFSLRANLLRWATLTPDLGIEWRISPSVGIMVNGSWTSWTWNDNARRYALWEVMPEVRWYLGEKKAWYVGAMFKAGQFNYKFSGTGRQGDLLGGGITGGYQLRLNKALALDFTLGLGYLNADTERYDVTDGVRVRSGNETKHWIGPINAGVTLVWKIF